ncbi:hypothetical protein GCM10010340_69410 [Streptomyces griseoloalbus]|nr:hypothetical protein GCM10010340_69410 [Streptomyces albaduncus]
MLSGLSALAIEDMADGDEIVRITARTRDIPVPCPLCGVVTKKAHGYHGRTVPDLPIDGRQGVVRVRIRRLVCPVLGCKRQTFREQVPGLLERHQRRTTPLTGQLPELVKELYGRASARLPGTQAVPLSYTTALRLSRRVPVPVVQIPQVNGTDDFALRRRHSYTTIITDADTMIPHRTSGVEETTLPPDYQRILAVAREAAGPAMARQVGEVLGVDVSVRARPEPLRGKLVRPADRGWPRKLPDGRFTTRL